MKTSIGKMASVLVFLYALCAWWVHFWGLRAEAGNTVTLYELGTLGGSNSRPTTSMTQVRLSGWEKQTFHDQMNAGVDLVQAFIGTKDGISNFSRGRSQVLGQCHQPRRDRCRI